MTVINEKKFELGEVISEAVSVFRDYKGLLLKISLCSVLISMVSNGLSIFRVYERVDFNLLFPLFAFILSFVTMYYSLKFDISMMFAVDELRNGEENDMMHYYRKTKGFVWPIIGINLLFGLILLIPTIMIAAGFVIPSGWPVKLFLIVLGAISCISIYTKFQFASLVRIFNPDNAEWFGTSSRLVNGNFFKAATLVLIYFSVPAIILFISQFFTLGNIGILSPFMELGLIFIFSLFFRPFQISLLVLSFRAFQDLQIDDNGNSASLEDNENQEVEI